MQIIVMTSDKQSHTLKGFGHQWLKYWGLEHQSGECQTVICGYKDIDLFYQHTFYSIGSQSDYPVHKWSDALIKVLNNVAEEIFILMLDDFWPIRQADINAIDMIYNYMQQFQNVIKFDLGYERLGAFGSDINYNTLGYLDLVKSNHASPYHMSLWGGMWRRDLLKKILVFGESAQQVELNGTSRLAQYGDEMLVLGTRQSPLRHANVIQAGRWNHEPVMGLPLLSEADRKKLRELGYIE
jgi:hypothetical protein